MSTLIQFRSEGIYVPKADIYIDPWKPVNKAVITHGHSDHARVGSSHYLTHNDNIPILKFRLSEEIQVQGLSYGETLKINDVEITLYPAGHILGSSQVLVESKGERWVISGDYKLESDPTCQDFEPIKCHHFVTESTFGLPVYNWKDPTKVSDEINEWWKRNQEKGKCSILIGYALGKAQRLISCLDATIGPIYTHGAVENINEIYRQANRLQVNTTYVGAEENKENFRGAIVVAPPSAAGSSWIRRFQPYSIGLASGWMAVRGAKRRRNVDKGFILSDHADWQGLNMAIKATEAENIYVTHGYTEIFSEWLNECGYNSKVINTEFEGELVEIGENTTEERT